jgi:hypothetical protein
MRSKLVLSTLAALVATAAVSSAATVSFTSSVISPADTGTFLDNSGTILDAVSFGPVRTGPFTYNAPGTASNPNPAPVLNGITFVSSANVGNPTGSHFAVGQVLASNPAAVTAYDSGRFSNIPSTNQPLFGLVYDVARTSANDARMTLNITNLTIGSSYEVQMIFSEINTADSGSTPADRTVQVAAGLFTAGANSQVGTGADGNSTNYNYGPTTGARIVTATFTADGTSELLNLLSNTTGGNSRVSLAGVVVSQVPEASSFALAVGGFAAFGFSRRRKLP